MGEMVVGEGKEVVWRLDVFFFFYGWDEDDERFGLEMGSSRKEKISCQRRVSIEVFSEFMIIAIMAIHALGRNQSLNLN